MSHGDRNLRLTGLFETPTLLTAAPAETELNEPPKPGPFRGACIPSLHKDPSTRACPPHCKDSRLTGPQLWDPVDNHFGCRGRRWGNGNTPSCLSESLPTRMCPPNLGSDPLGDQERVRRITPSLGLGPKQSSFTQGPQQAQLGSTKLPGRQVTASGIVWPWHHIQQEKMRGDLRSDPHMALEASPSRPTRVPRQATQAQVSSPSSPGTRRCSSLPPAPSDWPRATVPRELWLQLSPQGPQGVSELI